MVFAPSYEGSSAISDTNGNLLFYCDGEKIWHRNHDWMKNDFGYPEVTRGYQGTITIPKPGSNETYYVFVISRCNGLKRLPLYYFTIDISREGGLGEVVAIDTLTAAWDAADKLTATFHANKKDIWVITRKYTLDSYAAFLVTENGVNPNPVLSPAPNRELSWGPTNFGPMKVSYNKQFLISTFMGDHTQLGGYVEICKFDDNSGQISFLYDFQMRYSFTPPNLPGFYEESACEFSPCSKFLYVAAEVQIVGVFRTDIYQFETKYLEDSLAFIQSGVLIDTIQGSNLQLAPDGRIYCFGKCSMIYPLNPLNNKVGRINNPGGYGIDCDYQSDVFEIQHGQVTYGIVNFLNGFLLRFDFEGQCALDTFYFDPWFFPEPTWIQWNFGDTASGSQNISYDLRPKHVFSHGGEYEVSVLLTYPSGRVEKTSRMVEVDSIPYPDLGPDTLICRGSSVTLDAGCNAQFFTWSTGQWGVSSITVSDS
ncbi:MAG: PKD domain-containing protein, partial [Bacteroidales bacterium]|nr:PKD domain-containing protein [Bacteroidales bacterium]